MCHIFYALVTLTLGTAVITADYYTQTQRQDNLCPAKAGLWYEYARGTLRGLLTAQLPLHFVLLLCRYHKKAADLMTAFLSRLGFTPFMKAVDLCTTCLVVALLLQCLNAPLGLICWLYSSAYALSTLTDILVVIGWSYIIYLRLSSSRVFELYWAQNKLA